MEKINFGLRKNFFLGLILLLIFIITERSLERVQKEKDNLDEKLQSLKIQIVEQQRKNQKLLDQITSQSDDEAVMLILKKELGVLSEGEVKVLFK